MQAIVFSLLSGDIIKKNRDTLFFLCWGGVRKGIGCLSSNCDSVILFVFLYGFFAPLVIVWVGGVEIPGERDHKDRKSTASTTGFFLPQSNCLGLHEAKLQVSPLDP